MSDTTPAQFAELRQMITPDKIGFLVTMQPRRIGGYAFMSFLEHRWFTPVPAPSKDYELARIEWEGMLLFLCLIPKSKLPAAQAIARELGLRFADGVPHVISSQGVAVFPIDEPNVFTLENIPGHFVYRNNTAENKTADDYEDEAVDRVVAESVQKFRQWQERNQTKNPT